MAGHPTDRGDGQWGEDRTGDLSVTAAMEEYHDLERQLSETAMRNVRSAVVEANADADADVEATHPHQSSRHASSSNTNGNSHDDDTVWGDIVYNSFDLPEFLNRGLIDRRTPSGGPSKRLGVSFKHLMVRAVESSSQQAKTLPRAILNSFGPDLYHFAASWLPFLRIKSTAPLVDLIRDFTGTVRHGEIMLVLGRPGSGCSTFLKAVANQRDSYVSVAGDVIYGPILADDQLDRFRGEVVYCEEDDRHFPTLTVGQTLWFALRNKTRKKESWTIPIVLESFLQMFGIEHTRNTQVGNEFVRGVSGGERKRVSLAETLATRASVVCWDNPTRGLDASTALSFVKSLRVWTDVGGRTTLVSLYQAGESIYGLVDKVLVIDDGRMLFQGPAEEAKRYFENLGFLCPPRQTTADFLTSVADKNARRFQPGREETCPKTPAELERAFRESEYYQRLLADVDEYEIDSKHASSEKHRLFEATVQDSKSKTVRNNSVYTVSFVRQVAACIQRQAWLLWGDKESLLTKVWIILAGAFMAGSLFYNLRDDTASAYGRTGVVFFSCVFLGWLQFAELFPAVTGRVTIERQRIFALCRPSAVAIARVVLDFPMLLAMVGLLALPLYFLGRFSLDAGAFWLWFLFVFMNTFSLTSMFRMWASLSADINDAIRFVGLFMNLLFMYGGYIIPRSTLMSDVPWFGWITYIDPMMYGYEALMSSQFSGRRLECVESMLVPRGPGIDSAHQGCAFAGSVPGRSVVMGEDYILVSYGFSRSNTWRNFGVLIAFTVFYIAITVLCVERIRYKSAGAQSLVFARMRTTKDRQAVDDKKVNPNHNTSVGSTLADAEHAMEPIGDGKSIFTFKDVSYTIPTPAGPKLLLDKVSGYAKPGKMVALMGRSGAGKTTLLNTLAQRQTVGVVSGSMLVNGRPLNTDFQRGTGFCEQMDMHEGTSTIREAFEFSALLRQEAAIPRAEKFAYVDRIISLLELDDIQDALVSSLTVEQRKRVTIGVELSARPKLLLFLDEPTSGLDSQSAMSTVRFLRKLSDAGQAIICTIHQPSMDLIEQFDTILALNSGGATFYFGPIGPNGSAVVDYFAQRGAHCEPGRNVAEFIIETAARGGTGPGQTDWHNEWLRSQERDALLAEIDKLVASGIPTTATAETPEAGVASSLPSSSPLSSPSPHTMFAASNLLQTVLLTRRMFVQQWRDPSYVYGRLFAHVLLGIFGGFTFWMLDNTIASLQSRFLLSSIVIYFVTPQVVNAGIFYFFQKRALWEVRELPSRTYGWVAFTTANIISEIPVTIVSSTLFFVLLYFPTGMPYNAGTAGYFYACTLLFSLWMASWAQWIGAFGPSVTVVSNILPVFLILTAMFNGLIAPYSTMTVFWKYTIYYIVPGTWYIRGILATLLPQVTIECADNELARFDPPDGQTCGTYAAGFLRDVVQGRGYLVDADATSNCGYCPYTTGTDYASQLNVQDYDRKLTPGLLLAFVIFNWVLVYALMYACRVKGWTFGFGPLSRGLKAAVGYVFGRRSKKKKSAAESA